jgi:hypothetical protein
MTTIPGPRNHKPLAEVALVVLSSASEHRQQTRSLKPHGRTSEIYSDFLSILSIKPGNWFYWADRAERADRAESKEYPVFMRSFAYVGRNQ